MVLKTTNVATVGNLKPNFFTLAFLFFHIVNFEKLQKAWQETVQGLWSISMSIIHDPHDYEHMICPVKRVREGTVFLVLSPASCDDCLYLWGMLRFWLGLDILVVHRTTDMNVLAVRHNFWWSRTTGQPSVVNAAIIIMKLGYIYENKNQAILKCSHPGCYILDCLWFQKLCCKSDQRYEACRNWFYGVFNHFRVCWIQFRAVPSSAIYAKARILRFKIS